MGVTPTLRVVPPSPGARSGDPGAAWTVFFGVDLEGVVLATNAIGLGVERIGKAVRTAGTFPDLKRLCGELTTRESAAAPALQAYLSPVTQWQTATGPLSLASPLIMGIVNLTTDSFSGDGVGRSRDDAVRKAESLREDGAAIIDVGGESARANRPIVDAEEEASFVAPVIEALAREGHCISVDTYKGPVATAALAAGAAIVNDISGLTAGTGAAEAAATVASGYVLNYSFSPPKRRPDVPPQYADVMAETLAWFEARLATLADLGLSRAQLIIDPGIAFGKSHDEDFQVLRRLAELGTFGLPVLLAHSRKNYIGSVTGGDPGDRDLETHLTTALAYERGARLFRVHDVAGTARALAMAEAFSAEPGAYAPDADSWPWRSGAEASHAASTESNAPPPAGQRW